MDIVLLANTLTAVLSPFLPYLLKASEQIAEDVGHHAGARAWEQAQKIWKKLRPQVEAKPSAQEAAIDLAQSPDDPDAQASFRQQLKKLLSEAPQLAIELSELLPQQPSPTQSNTKISQRAGDRAVQIGRIDQAKDINISR